MLPARRKDGHPGRHCMVCGRIGGTPVTIVLRKLGYEFPKNEAGYAHPHCVAAAKLRAVQ